MAGEHLPIPPYANAPRARGGMVLVRFVLALPAYFLTLYVVIVPGYPLPVPVKGALGFLLAGAAAGSVARNRGWLAGLFGFLLVAALVLVTVTVTLGSPFLGPAFLINGATAHGKTAAVGAVLNQLVVREAVLAGGAALLSVVGGVAGSWIERRPR